MAWMNQEKKAKIAAALKNAVPGDWKYTLRVRDHRVICMVIRSAPLDLVKMAGGEGTSFDINHYHIDKAFNGYPEIQGIFKEIVDALNTGNWDNSDIQSDYFDVGHYVNLSIGEWNKPFVVT